MPLMKTNEMIAFYLLYFSMHTDTPHLILDFCFSVWFFCVSFFLTFPLKTAEKKRNNHAEILCHF